MLPSARKYSLLNIIRVHFVLKTLIHAFCILHTKKLHLQNFMGFYQPNFSNGLELAPVGNPSRKSILASRAEMTAKMAGKMAKQLAGSGTGQSFMDRVTQAKYSLAGSALGKVVAKASTEELIAPKRKHLESKRRQFLFSFCRFDATEQ